MKQLLLFFIILWSLNLSAQEMQKYLQDTKEMVKTRNYKEALERHIWFHEHALEKEPAMGGVRLSFALSDWKTLASVYPPAMIELRGTRDRTIKKLMSNSGTPQLFSDVKALNRTLGESAKTVELFELLLKEYPDVAKSSWHFAKDDLFDAKRYDIIKKFVGDPMREYAMLTSKYGRDTTMAKGLHVGSDHFKSFSANNFVEKSLQLIDFAIACDDLPAAKQVQIAAMKVVKDYRLRDAIPVGK